MFHSARIKLTLWYLAIILFISLLFSVVIFSVLNNELMRIERVQSIRMDRQRDLYNSLPPEIQVKLPRPPVQAVEIEEARARVILSLIVVDSSILLLSAIIGYMLAGMTLKPIQNMVDEQNQFIADASHELRTPLTALKSSIEVALRDKKLTLLDAKELIKSNLEEVNELQSLSDSLLQLAQYQRIDQTMSIKEGDISTAIHESVKKVSGMAQLKQIHINVESNSEKIETDMTLVTEILIVLLDNAIKYSNPDESIALKAYRTDGIIRINVIDQGIGISEHDLPHIFKRFYRSDKSRSKEEVGGYGLGLSIAKKITEVLHGSIYVTSVENKGSTFTVDLPVKQKKIS